MLAARYAQAVRDIVARIESTQLDAIQRAGEAIAASLAGGGAFWVHGIGHGGDRELTSRAGGLMATRIFSFGLRVDSPIAASRKGRPRPDAADLDLEAVRLAVRTSEMRAGDALMLASVSGRNREPIELTLAAQSIGATVIAITSREYTAQVESLHPSGKKLCDVADIVIDNCAPFGDACLDLPGADHKALPISGAAQVTISWMVCGAVIDALRALGKSPHIYMSHNRPGGDEYNAQALEEYNEIGY